jgi:hypothetical protein
MPVVFVPAERWERWVENFRGRHGETALQLVDGGLSGSARDGSTFSARLPFDVHFEGLPESAAFAAAVATPLDWGMLLVRKGGFAIARLRHDEVVDSKVGQRHVQGRTKAGGQSQQRFARRRGNQARLAYEAAAEHAARILGDAELGVVTGGDHAAVEEVLGDQRLRRLRVVGPWLAVGDPKRAVLEQAIVDGSSILVEVTNA